MIGGASKAAGRYARRDGTTVRAEQFDGRTAGFYALLQSFPGRIAPHPSRDDAVLVTMASGGQTRVTTGDWVVEAADLSLTTAPDDQFRISLLQPEAIAA